MMAILVLDAAYRYEILKKNLHRRQLVRKCFEITMKIYTPI